MLGLTMEGCGLLFGVAGVVLVGIVIGIRVRNRIRAAAARGGMAAEDAG
ncbi:MAG: hypothetical protein ACYTFZ_04850 [Planctomycetota bacterium]|jgi:hypothetical protein